MKRFPWRTFWTSALVCVALSGFSSAHAGKKSLRVTSEPGTKRLYRMQAQNETSFAGMVITENQSGDVEVEALEHDADDNPRFAFRFANFDASVMQGDNMAEQDPQLNGVVVHVTLSPRGEQLNLSPQSNLSPERRRLVRGIAEAFFAYLPEDQVDRDDTWVQERLEEGDEDGTPAIDGEMEYTLENFEKKDGQECAKLHLEGEFKVNSLTPGGPFAGKAKTEGETLVALSGGHVMNSKVTTEITGSVGTQEVSRVQYLELKMRKP